MFPFADGLISAVEAGATSCIQPGGSIRDEEVIIAADERDVAPASTAEIKPSANGNIASLATELPLKERPASLAFQIAIRHESTRDICPAPIPTVEPSFAYTIAFDLTCLVTLKANKRSAISWSDG
jgi:hypothetical protein